MFVNFFNSFMSYLLLVIVIVIVAGVAIFIGIKLAKYNNKRKSAMNAENITKDEKGDV